MKHFLFILGLVSLINGQPLSKEENEQLQTSCGKTLLQKKPRTNSFRSMNTKLSTRNDAPFTVLIRFSVGHPTSPEGKLAQSTDSCTGTVISKRHVLTAAHCLAEKVLPKCNKTGPISFVSYFEANNQNYVDKLDYLLIVAPTTCNKTKCDSVLEKKVVNPKRAFVPKAWIQNFCKEKGTLRGDVAVIELEEEIAFNNLLQPACLYDRKTGTDTTITLFGYGMTQSNLPESSGVLRKHKSVTLSRDKCSNIKVKFDPTGFMTYPNGKFRFLEDEICSTSNEGAMACQVDSGSGLIVKQKEKSYVTAVASYGPLCNPGKAITIRDKSTEIYLHLEWIAAATGIHPKGQPSVFKGMEKFFNIRLNGNLALEKVTVQ